MHAQADIYIDIPFFTFIDNIYIYINKSLLRRQHLPETVQQQSACDSFRETFYFFAVETQ